MVFIIIGGFLILVLYVMVFMLGMIAAGIQALRLNYVEFFRKFYKGNGLPFQPFGMSRRGEVGTNVSEIKKKEVKVWQ